jgi:transposase
MVNVLQMHEQQAIATLASQGWSIRRIARQLKLHRRTVRRYCLAQQESDSKCATISTAGNGPKCTISTAGKAGRKSLCDSLGKIIAQKLAQGLSAQRIYQDLRIEVAFSGSYESVKRFVRVLRRAAPEAVRRIEVAPGEEVQVDFGAGAPILNAVGRKRRTWIFRIVLSFSRKGYSEAVFRQDTETFVRCLENAFRHFGGVAQTINLDNLKAAVLKFDFADPQLNPKLAEFARHYGCAILPCLPGTPQHKGKVENSVGYVKENALKARVFDSLAAQNQYLAYWESNVADRRIHGTTKRQVAQLFAEEQKHLLPLPASIFPVFQEAPRSVHRDSYVEVAKAYYAVPPEYIGEKLWVRWDTREVRIFNTGWQQVQIHRRLEPGQFSKALGIGGGEGTLRVNLQYWQRRARQLGSGCAQWSEVLVQQRGIEAMRSLMGLVSLSQKHSFGALNQACAKAASKGAWRLRDVRALLDSREVQTELSFAEHHPLIRNLSEYGLFIKAKNL